MQVFKKRSLALVSALFLAISPWHLHFSRSAYDLNFSVFFYLLGITIFIYEVKQKRMPILALLSFLFAIFSYRAMNVIFPPLAILLIWYGIKTLNMKRKQIVLFVVGIIIIILVLLITIIKNGQRYIAEASLFNNPKMQEEIDTQIREAQGPLFVRRLFLSKPTYIINKFRENYIRAYSPEFLFLYTEPSKIYSIWSRGRIYFIDLIFIVLGIAYLYKISKSGATFIILLALIAPLPGMIGGFPYSARNFFLSVILPVLSAGGVFFLFNSYFLKRFRTITIVIIILGYTYVFGSYIFDYYGRYALYGAEAWAKSLKDLSLLITENKKKYDKIIVGQASFGDLIQYAFYIKVRSSDVQKAWHKRQKGASESFLIENVTFTTPCLENKTGGLPAFREYKSVLYIVHDDCSKTATPSSLIKDYHGNTVWKIYDIVHSL